MKQLKFLSLKSNRFPSNIMSTFVSFLKLRLRSPCRRFVPPRDDKNVCDRHVNMAVVSSGSSTPLDPSNVVKAYKRSLKAAGLPEIRFHDLRHTAATLMLQQSIKPKIVQERLGHSDISLTLNAYSHVLPHMQEEAAEKMDELLTLIEVSDELKQIREPEKKYKDTP